MIPLPNIQRELLDRLSADSVSVTSGGAGGAGSVGVAGSVTKTTDLLRLMFELSQHVKLHEECHIIAARTIHEPARINEDVLGTDQP